MLTPILIIVIREMRGLINRPTQVLTLILGPLVLMICFGIGSDATAGPPRAVVVMQPGQERPRLLRDYQRQFDEYLNVVAYTDDEARARALLQQGKIDAVVILPVAPFDTIAGGEQATIRVLYDQIDPIWRLVVPEFTRVLAGAINREIFLQTVGAQQTELSAAAASLDGVIALLIRASDAADAWDRAATAAWIEQALAQLGPLEEALDRLGPQAAPLKQRVVDLRAQLEESVRRLANLEPALLEPGGQPLKERLGLPERLRQVRQLRVALEQLTAVPPEVVISPIAVEARNLARLQPDIVTFYAPSIIALLVQHIAVSMGALAMVRERLMGVFDLYSVAPSGNLQLLLGKYAAYSLFTLMVAVIVLLVLLLGLQVPLLGSPWRLTLALILLTLASVGLGLALSLLATSERQAVQFAMLGLLAVVFFSGFTLPLDALRQPALLIAYTLPATYGVALLQDVMLRGTGGDTTAFLSLAGIALALFGAASGLLFWRTRPR